MHDDLSRARSYDDVAAEYERVNAPLMFDAPARALVASAAVERAERVLDVGAGSGAVSRAAIAATGSLDAVHALDPSVAMLEAAARAGVRHLVNGALPHLPFASSCFDVVLSAFVLTHVEEPDTAARDMHRVLRAGGRVALSAWAPSDDAAGRAWREVALEFVGAEALERATLRVLPGEPRLSQRQGQADLLRAAGFAGVRTETRSFHFALSADQVVTSREVGATGRALRALLRDPEWNACRERSRRVLGKKFPNGIRYERGVFIALGWKR
jgi:ubiquinone/menaquinone biosynthesis C-methylase UbiE